MIRRMILPEIAEQYKRTEHTIRWWRYRYPWPSPVGTRGRYDEYDAGEVDQAVAAILAIGDAGDQDPGELLDARQAAAEAGVAYGTLRGYVSRGDWPEPDDDAHGVKRWKRSTVREKMASRRPSSRRRARKAEA